MFIPTICGNQSASIAPRRSTRSATFRDTMPLAKTYQIFSAGDGRELLRIYTYQNRHSATVRAMVWIDCGRAIGIGSAGGSGYEKHSHAIGDALRDAGVSLAYGVDGAGMPAVMEAGHAIARALLAPGLDYILQTGTEV